MKDWLIIDGYNLLCRIFPKTPGAGAAIIARNRKNMLALIEPLVNLLAAKITIVYDGAAVEPRPGELESEIIEVVYTPPNISADSYIENLVWKAARPENILVVTSDRMERDGSAGYATIIRIYRNDAANMEAELAEIRAGLVAAHRFS